MGAGGVVDDERGELRGVLLVVARASRRRGRARQAPGPPLTLLVLQVAQTKFARASKVLRRALDELEVLFTLLALLVHKSCLLN
jgi:hypothetical protein